MVRKISTALAMGLLALGETGIAISGPPPRTAFIPQQTIATKRIPQSRLVKPKPSQPQANSVLPRQLGTTKPRTVSQAAPNSQPVAPPRFDEPASRLFQPPLREPAEKLPTNPVAEETLPAEKQPPDAPLEDDLLPEPVREPEPELETEPKVDPLDEPAPPETGPLDLEQPAPSTAAEPEQTAEDLPAPRGTIYRLEPPSKLVPVSADELKPGVIYLHDDPHVGRPVWSFVQDNGRFWHAFGPGTTQALIHFDLQMTEDEALETLRKIEPKLAFEVTNEGARVFLRLQADNTWKLVRINSVPSIFDLETNQRWEQQWGRYLPVTHNCGDTWAYRNGQYWAPNWDESMRPN